MLRKLYLPLGTIIFVLAILGAGVFALQYNGEAEPYSGPERDSYEDGTDLLAQEGNESTAHKNETVYVLLEHDGKLIEYSIVNRIYGIEDDAAELIADYGNYISAENMTSPIEPDIREDRVTWPAYLLQEGDLYYEGIIDKELPFTLEITYYLDGEQILPEKLAGSSGRLDLVMHFTNHLLIEQPAQYYDYEGNRAYTTDDIYVPLLVQGSLELDLDKFTNIEHDDSLSIVMGQNATINFMSFPYPEAEVIISMDGVEIELDRINFMVAPQLPPLVEVDLEDALLQMVEGLAPISEGLAGLSAGADYLLQGLARFETESRELLLGTEDVLQLIREYRQQRESYMEMINTADHEAILNALENLNGIIEQIEKVPDPGLMSAELDQAGLEMEIAAEAYASLSDSVSIARASTGSIVEQAEALTAENVPGTELHNLGLAILKREQQIGQLMTELDLAGSTFASARSALENASDYWVTEYYPALSALEELNEVMQVANRDFPGMVEELDRLVHYLNETDQYIARSEEMLESLDEIAPALERMMAGQRDLRDGISQLNESGIMVMEENLIDAVNKSRAGKAQMELMRESADQYRSFADNDHNRHSEVRFIVQTPRLVYPEPDLATEQEDVQNASVEEHWALVAWEKLILLFK